MFGTKTCFFSGIGEVLAEEFSDGIYEDACQNNLLIEYRLWISQITIFLCLYNLKILQWIHNYISIQETFHIWKINFWNIFLSSL